MNAHGALDIRLLRTLNLLLQERSVSRTAELLGQTQPTISLALKRLRDLIGDPLLVRSGGTLVPTERGLELLACLPSILNDIDSRLSPLPVFDPRDTTRLFRLISANCLGPVLLPRLFQAINAEAPRARLDLEPMPSYGELMDRLANGSVDAVIGNWPNPPGHLRLAPLVSMPIVCVMRRGHPLAGLTAPMSMDTYLASDHVSPTPPESLYLSPIDGRLLELGLKRNVVTTVPEYAIARHFLNMSDQIFTTGISYAEQLAATGEFCIIPAPEVFGQMNFYLLWHDCKHYSPAHIWLRQKLKTVAGNLRMGEMDNGLYPAAAE